MSSSYHCSGKWPDRINGIHRGIIKIIAYDFLFPLFLDMGFPDLRHIFLQFVALSGFWESELSASKHECRPFRSVSKLEMSLGAPRMVLIFDRTTCLLY